MGVMSSPFDLRSDFFVETFHGVIGENNNNGEPVPVTEQDIVDGYNNCSYTYPEACSFLQGMGYGPNTDCEDILITENAEYEERDCDTTPEDGNGNGNGNGNGGGGGGDDTTIDGCTDASYANYNPEATHDDGSCSNDSDESDMMTTLKDNWLLIGIVVVGLAAIAS